jgi:hypothetical protein
MTDRNDRIREVAYFLWLEDGCPEGQAERHWSTAEALLASGSNASRSRASLRATRRAIPRPPLACQAPARRRRAFGDVARLSRQRGPDSVDNAAAKGVTRKATAGVIKRESGFDAADERGASGPVS